jgi:hypothetical protein
MGYLYERAENLKRAKPFTFKHLRFDGDQELWVLTRDLNNSNPPKMPERKRRSYCGMRTVGISKKP